MVTVRAVYTEREAVFHLTWDDPTASDPTKGAPKPDMIAVQFPTGQGTGDRPYFLMGDGSHPVYLLTWRAGGKRERKSVGWVMSVEASVDLAGRPNVNNV